VGSGLVWRAVVSVRIVTVAELVFREKRRMGGRDVCCLGHNWRLYSQGNGKQVDSRFRIQDTPFIKQVYGIVMGIGSQVISREGKREKLINFMAKHRQAIPV
jgi:hypothetical protein